MGFIKPDQKLLVIETNNLQFGPSGSVITATLNLDESIVTATPTITKNSGQLPFSFAISSGSSKPVITLTLDGIIANYSLGTNYEITLTANGESDTFNIQFLFSQFFDPSAWDNADKESNIGGFFTLTQIPQGAEILSNFVNSRLRSITEFVGLLNFRVLDLLNRYKIKKNLPDIINSAIFAGSIPQGYAASVTYIPGTSQFSTIILQDDNLDSDSFTKITFNYTSVQKTITDNSVTPAVQTNSNYNALSDISVDRIIDNTGTAKRYNIMKVTVNRTNTTFTSIVDSSYSITMPLITGWMVVA